MIEQLLGIKITLGIKNLKNEQKRHESHGAYDLIRNIGKKGNSYNTVCMSTKKGDLQRNSGDPEMGEAEARPSVKICLNIDSLQ